MVNTSIVSRFLPFDEIMACCVSSGHGRWKQWWKKSSFICCSKKLMLLLVWYFLFIFSSNVVKVYTLQSSPNTKIFLALIYFANFFAPLIGWLADVKFGRYKIIKIGSLVSFFASILYYAALRINYFCTERCVLFCFYNRYKHS